ncbi:MAG: aldose 1-epimerase family protein [Eubacteriales bacterium]|nr:aldose 1-epimerase family protein [Eubacteriales bacterium]
MGVRTISNAAMTVEIETRGAQLKSIRDAQGHEYLWQGDPAYWKGRAYNLFPFIGRMEGQTYTLFGKSYSLDPHGFARGAEFEVCEESGEEVVFLLRDSEETYAHYPYHFAFRIRYRLIGNRLETTYLVENGDEKEMYFAVGGHPGFFVPMEEGLRFEDYVLEFETEGVPGEAEAAKGVRIVHMSEKALPDRIEPYELEEGKRISLRHDLFDNDAVVLTDMPRCVTIRTPGGKRAVRVDFPQMPYVGFWHVPGKEAPYVCVEPWSSLPGWDGTDEVFEKQEDLLHVNPGETYRNVWGIEIL